MNLAVLSDTESKILKTLVVCDKRDGVFPPTWTTVFRLSAVSKPDEFSKSVYSLQERGYLKVARGKLRGICLTKQGYEY